MKETIKKIIYKRKIKKYRLYRRNSRECSLFSTFSTGKSTFIVYFYIKIIGRTLGFWIFQDFCGKSSTKKIIFKKIKNGPTNLAENGSKKCHFYQD